MLKKLFPLSFLKKTVLGVVLYLALYLAGSLTKGIIITFTSLNGLGGGISLFTTVYVFIGLFVLCLKHLGYIKEEQ